MKKAINHQPKALSLVLSVLSALILAMAFLNSDLGLFAFVGLVTLFFAIQNKTPKQAFIFSYIAGFLFFFLSMYWLYFVTPSGWIILSLYQALYIGIFGLLCSFLLSAVGYRLSAYLSIPSIWCMLEYLRSNVGGGIGWNILGYSQYENLPVIQIADITGVYGVSFLIVLINFSVFSSIKMAIRCCRTHKRLFEKSNAPLMDEIRFNPLIETIFVFIVAIAALAYGYQRIGALTKEDSSSKKLKISVVQGNIDQLYKWDAAYKDYIKGIYKKLTFESAEDGPQLIVWPETSLPGYPDQEQVLSSYIQGILKKIKTPLLMGAPTVAKKGGEDIGDYNSALLFSKDGRLLDKYNKLHLVAFGEFVPFEKYFPCLRKILPITGNFIPGTEYTVFNLQPTTYNPQPKFGVLICFEDIFPNMVRQFVKNGAGLMINITNDAWFGKTAAAYQHAANSVFRAVENRKPFVRSANTGLSCFIDSSGRIYDKVSIEGRDLFVEGCKTADVKIMLHQPHTFYTRHGDVFMLVCLLILGLFMIDYRPRRRYNN